MISKYFSPDYLFGQPIGVIMKSDKAIFYFGLALIVMGLLLYLYAASVKHLLKKLLVSRWANLGFWIGILFTLWYFLRYEIIFYLSLHVVAYAILLIGLVWAYYNLKYQFGRYKQQLAEYQRQQQRNKYL